MPQAFSWSGHPAPLLHPEHELWSLAKAGQRARALLTTLPYGVDLRAEVDGAVVLSRLFRVAEPGLDAQAAEWRSGFERLGWTATP